MIRGPTVDIPAGKLLRIHPVSPYISPIHHAGMRELWNTGYMHQNVRMAVACFLTEYLNFHWVLGARWFHDTLVDADVAINSMMWQNAGKSGLDQWNFTVVPTSKSLDPAGDYIRRYGTSEAGQYATSRFLGTGGGIEDRAPLVPTVCTFHATRLIPLPFFIEKGLDCRQFAFQGTDACMSPSIKFSAPS